MKANICLGFLVVCLSSTSAYAQRIVPPSPLATPAFVLPGEWKFQKVRVTEQLLVGPILPYLNSVRFQVEHDLGVEDGTHTLGRLYRGTEDGTGVAFGYHANGVTDIGGFVRGTGLRKPVALSYFTYDQFTGLPVERPILWAVPGEFGPEYDRVQIVNQAGVGTVHACLTEDGTLQRCVE